ncbi:MAG: phage integrase N-terminal SAM-like domain-containing protein [Desulfobacterales bacterium]
MSSNLREQFIDYMTLQGFSECTQEGYVSAVKGLAKFYNLSPDLLTSEQIHDYFRYLIAKRKVSWSTCNKYLSGIICFYKNICQWEDVGRFGIPPRPYQKQLPVTLSIEEVKRLFSAVTNLKHRVLLKTAYSAGLRVSELINLKPHHIESDPSRMLIRVEQGKGRKDRYTLLSQELLDELRSYYRKYQPKKWLFPGYDQEKHLSYAAARKVFMSIKKKLA